METGAIYGFPKPELTDGGDTLAEKQAFRTAYNDAADDFEEALQTAIGTGGLPEQTGHDGQYLKTNGTVADWAAAAGGGDVTGPAGAVAGNLPVLDATGKILSDSGSKPADFAAALGADDNYVTDAEKTVIGNTSGTNTGDQTIVDILPDMTDQAGKYVKVNATEDGVEYDSPTGTGDMEAATYDPQNIADDAFDRANHTGTQDASTITLTIPVSNGVYSGNPLTGVAGETLAAGDVVYFKAADSRLWKAKADAAGTMPAVGVIVVGGNAADSVTYIDNGYLFLTAWNWTIGGKAYVSPATAGLITQTAPATEGQQLQELGYAYSADVLRIVINSVLVEIGDGMTDLTSEVEGILPTANGGTGIAYFTAAGPTEARVYTFPDAATTVCGLATTQTLTNKRVTRRVGQTESSATPTINTDNYDAYELTAQAADITSFTTNLTGTPVNGDLLRIAITGTAARAIAWGASFEASTVALPTTTVSTDRLDVGFIYNGATSKWRCIAVA